MKPTKKTKFHVTGILPINIKKLQGLAERWCRAIHRKRLFVHAVTTIVRELIYHYVLVR